MKASHIPASAPAYDNYDGDLSDKIVKTLTDSSLILTVSDSSGNEARREIPVTYQKDLEPPVLTLNGETDFFVNLEEGYTEPGFQAIDNCDGDISSRVVVTGAPRRAKPAYIRSAIP